MSTLTGLIEEAKLAEQAERYEDMAKVSAGSVGGYKELAFV